jgi:hypothetical protein
MAKAKQRYSWQRNADKGTATKVDSETEKSLTILGFELPKAIQAEIFVYGISKIIDDRLSQVAADLKLPEMSKLTEQFQAGEWKAERTAGARFLPTVIEAIAKIKGCSVAAAQAAYRGLDEEQRTVLKGNLAEQITAIEEAREKAAEVGLDDLLS